MSMLRKIGLFAAAMFAPLVAGAAIISGPAGLFIQIRETLQPNATYYVSSGTVAGQLSVGSIKFQDGTTQTTAGGGGGGSADNLGSHIATKTLDMGGFAITNVATVTASRQISAGRVRISTDFIGPVMYVENVPAAQQFNIRTTTSTESDSGAKTSVISMTGGSIPQIDLFAGDSSAPLTVNPSSVTFRRAFVSSVLDCSGNSNGGALTADANGLITCSDDNSGGGGGGGGTTIEVEDGGVSKVNTSTVNFRNGFIVSDDGGEAAVDVDFSSVTATSLSLSSAAATYVDAVIAGYGLMGGGGSGNVTLNLRPDATTYAQIRGSEQLGPSGTTTQVHLTSATIGQFTSSKVLGYSMFRAAGKSPFYILPMGISDGWELQSAAGSLYLDSNSGLLWTGLGTGRSVDFVATEDITLEGRGGGVTIKKDGGVGGRGQALKIEDDDASAYTAFTSSPAMSSNVVNMFPGSLGSVGQVLKIAAVMGSTVVWTNGTDDTGGGGGGSSLAVATGTISGFTRATSSPTAVINFDSQKFAGQLTGSGTFYVTITTSGVSMYNLNATGFTGTGGKILREDGVWVVAQTTTPSANPCLEFYDSDATISTRAHATICQNLTATGDGSEKSQVTFTAIVNGSTVPYMVVNSTDKIYALLDVSVPDEAYGSGWDGSLEAPTKNALYDKIETLGSGPGGGGGYSMEPATVTIRATGKGIITSTLAYTGNLVFKADSYSAGAGICQQTSGCTNGVRYQTSVTSTNYVAATFAKSATQYWNLQVPLPQNYPAISTITVQIVWTSTGSSGVVSWYVDAKSVSDDDALDGSWGTAVEITDTNTASGDFLKTAMSGEITIANTPTGGDDLFLRIYRGVNDSSDTWSGDARFIRAIVYYPIDNASAKD